VQIINFSVGRVAFDGVSGFLVGAVTIALSLDQDFVPLLE